MRLPAEAHGPRHPTHKFVTRPACGRGRLAALRRCPTNRSQRVATAYRDAPVVASATLDTCLRADPLGRTTGSPNPHFQELSPDRELRRVQYGNEQPAGDGCRTAVRWRSCRSTLGDALRAVTRVRRRQERALETDIHFERGSAAGVTLPLRRSSPEPTLLIQRAHPARADARSGSRSARL